MVGYIGNDGHAQFSWPYAVFLTPNKPPASTLVQASSLTISSLEWLETLAKARAIHNIPLRLLQVNDPYLMLISGLLWAQQPPLPSQEGSLWDYLDGAKIDDPPEANEHGTAHRRAESVKY